MELLLHCKDICFHLTFSKYVFILWTYASGYCRNYVFAFIWFVQFGLIPWPSAFLWTDNIANRNNPLTKAISGRVYTVQVLEVTTLHVLCFLQVKALLLEYMVMGHPCLIWRKLKHSIEQSISKIISEMIKNKWLDLVLWSEHNHGYQKNLRTNSKDPEGSV